MNLIERLQEIEHKHMADILSGPNSDFSSLDIDYHPPHVERIQIKFGEYRLSFHVLHPCDEDQALYHPHPWESAVHVIQGVYEMGLSKFDPNAPANTDLIREVVKDNQICRIQAYEGMYYEMLNPEGWHYVRPKTIAYSTMLTHKQWHRTEKATEELKPLSEERVNFIRAQFRSYYKNNAF